MRRQPDSVMLFAAGFGKRMGALTRNRPKPLVPVAGRALIDHALDLVNDFGARRIVANTHYHAEMMRAHLEPAGVTISEEHPRILETGGGLKAALGLLGPDPVFTLNTDAIWSGQNPLRLLAQAWNPEEMDALLMCVTPERAQGHPGGGDFTTPAKGPVTRGPGLIYCGAQIIKTDRLSNIAKESFSLNLLWEMMLEERRLSVLSYPGRWCDVGSPEGIALAERILADGNV